MTNKSKPYHTLILMLAMLFTGMMSGFMLPRPSSSSVDTNQSTQIEALETAEEEVGLAFTRDMLIAEQEAYYQEKLEALLTPEEITYLAQRQWQAHLAVNGQEITSSTLSLDGPKNIRVMFGEVVLQDDLLPEPFLARGRLDQPDSGEPLTDYVEVITDHPYEIIKEESPSSVKYYYEFKEVPSGTMIIFQMNTILKEKLKNEESLRDGRFDIIVK